MAKNEADDTTDQAWGDCERCGEKNCVMVCHVDRLRGAREFMYLGAEGMKDVQLFANSVAEGNIGVACTECGHTEGVTSDTEFLK